MRSAEAKPATTPTARPIARPSIESAACGATGNTAPAPSSGTRSAAPTVAATATGTKLRGFHSNSSSSTASSTAAIGAAKIAAIPAAAPATRRVLRSLSDRWKACANTEPNAAPVMMMGPSAPKGPPVPIASADESGFSTATFALSLLRPMRIASMASGMPWPRIFSEPKRAMSPIARPPTTGTRTAARPSRFRLGASPAADSRWKYASAVIASISRTRIQATTAPIAPTTADIAAMRSMRGRAVKSPSRSAAWEVVVMP